MASTTLSPPFPLPLCRSRSRSRSRSVEFSILSPITSLNNSLIPEFSIHSANITTSSTKIPRNLSRQLRLKLNCSPVPVNVKESDDHTTYANTIDIDIDKGSPQFPTQPPPLHSCIWKWRGYSIRYQCCGDTGPALVLIHGFGANSDHWRKNLPVLGNSHRVYSIDLIGYGYSDKPNPRNFKDTCFYTFETWASQIIDFCLEVVKDEAFFICNSIGGLVGLQAAVMAPQICKGLVLLNISLRMLHIKKQPLLAKPLIKSFQSLLRCGW